MHIFLLLRPVFLWGNADFRHQWCGGKHHYDGADKTDFCFQFVGLPASNPPSPADCRYKLLLISPCDKPKIRIKLSL